MITYTIRQMRKPDDYDAVAELINFIASEPTSGKLLEEDDAKIPPGQLDYNEEGSLRAGIIPNGLPKIRRVRSPLMPMFGALLGRSRASSCSPWWCGRKCE